jgi:protein-tyrosine phosphatase
MPLTIGCRNVKSRAGVVSDAVRSLEWEGCFNARDLGGLVTDAGRELRRGTVVRADSLDGLTPKGWESLLEHGVRTAIDLRNASERDATVRRPAEITTIWVPLDGEQDREFWGRWEGGPQFGTPLYYRPHIERFPERSVAALRAIAEAGPGGVVVHCQGGRDRTGQIVTLLLCLAGVPAPAIARDYALAAAGASARRRALAELDEGPELQRFLADRGTTAETLIAELAGSTEVDEQLRAGGLDAKTTRALRSRLLSPAREEIRGP